MVQSVEKALRLLQTLALHGDWIGVRELSRKMKLSPPTIHSLLQTMVAASFAETSPATRQYRLGVAAIRLGEGSNPLNNFRLIARPYIEELAAKSGETVALLTWQDHKALVVDWIQANHPLAVNHRHGVVDHPLVFASGRVLLAYQSPAEQMQHLETEDLAKLGRNCPRTRQEYRALLSGVVEQGYAVTENVADSGVLAIGAPVFGPGGKIVLAVGCSAPISRASRKQVDLVKKSLLEIAASMTQHLSAATAV